MPLKKRMWTNCNLLLKKKAFSGDPVVKNCPASAGGTRQAI